MSMTGNTERCIEAQRDHCTGHSIQVWLVRHTPTAVGERVCYGRSDVELATGWEGDWARTMQKIPAQFLARAQLFSSPLTRCRRLAEQLARPVTTDPRLREFHFGDWELRPWDEIPRSEIGAWAADVHAPVPGGESLADVYARTSEFLAERLCGDERDTLIISHSGVIRCALVYALGMEIAGAFRISVDYGSVSAVGIERDRLKVYFMNT